MPGGISHELRSNIATAPYFFYTNKMLNVYGYLKLLIIDERFTDFMDTFLALYKNIKTFL